LGGNISITELGGRGGVLTGVKSSLNTTREGGGGGEADCKENQRKRKRDDNEVSL